MNLLEPGLREIGRISVRLATRVRLRKAREQRDKALTELGLLGWQQAEFDSDTQRQVDEIQNVEREQSRQVNLAAEKAREIRKLTEARAEEQRAFGEKLRGVELEFKKAQEASATLEKAASNRSRVEPHFEKRIPELDRELREVNKLYAELLMVEKQTPKMKQELIRLRERSVAIPNEKSDLRTQHLRAVTELRSLEDESAGAREALAAAQQRVAFVKQQWEDRDGTLASQIKAVEREKGATEKHLSELERAKTNPYLRIGEVLANCGIAPVNQPETLDKVRDIDVAIALLEEKHASSIKVTADQDPSLLQKSLWLVGGLTLLLVCLLLLLF